MHCIARIYWYTGNGLTVVLYTEIILGYWDYYKHLGLAY